MEMKLSPNQKPRPVPLLLMGNKVADPGGSGSCRTFGHRHDEVAVRSEDLISANELLNRILVKTKDD